MNPRHFLLNVDPNDGSIWLVLAKPGQPKRRIKEMTDEILLALCADISAALDEDDNVKSIERSVIFADGMECKVNVHLTKLPDYAKRGTIKKGADGVAEFGGMVSVETV